MISKKSTYVWKLDNTPSTKHMHMQKKITKEIRNYFEQNTEHTTDSH
jgi:hypothetical protein